MTAIAVACGGGGGSTTDDAGGAYGDGVEVNQKTTTSKGAAETTAAAAAATPGTAAQGSATTKKGAATTAAPLPVQTTAAPAPVVTTKGQDPIVAYAKGGAGQAAGVILAPTPAQQITVEVLQQPGAPVNQAALDKVAQVLRDLSGKPVNVTPPVALPASAEGQNKVWSPVEMAKVADANTKIPQGGKQIVLKYLYLRGGSSNSAALGVAFRGDLLSIFPDRAGGATQRAVEAISIHETGHLLGLVDGYLDRGRSDTANDPAKHGHSSNKESVMYWSVNPTVTGLILQNPSLTFDAADLRDLNAIKAGAKYGANPA